MEHKTIKKMIALSSVAVAVLGLSGCGNETKKITDSMDEKDYQEALRIYGEWEMESDERGPFVEAMRTELSEAVEKYANGTFTYEEATAVVSTIHEMLLDELSMDETTAYTEIESLKISKEMFKAGEEALAQKEYLKAIIHFERVISSDVNYETAVAKITEAETAYVEEALAEAQKLVDKKEYVSALELLAEASTAFPEVEAISEKITEVQNAYVGDVLTEAQSLADKKSFDAALELLERVRDQMPEVEAIGKKITEIQVTRVLDEAESTAKSGDYEGALILLDEFSNNASEEAKELISNAYDVYAKEYVNMIMQKVAQLRSDKSYIQALQMLENAYMIVPSPDFTAMSDVINNEKPMYLCEVKCQNQDRYELHTTGDAFVDTLGNSYPVGNLHTISSADGGWSDDYKGFAEYYLGYKYSKMTGVIAPEDSSANVNCSINIEGDGVTLLSLDINRLTEPYHFELDVSMVNYLKISSGDIDGDGSFTTILYDFTLTK